MGGKGKGADEGAHDGEASKCPVADVAREHGVDPKVARASLRAAGMKSKKGRWLRIWRCIFSRVAAARWCGAILAEDECSASRGDLVVDTAVAELLAQVDEREGVSE